MLFTIILTLLAASPFLCVQANNTTVSASSAVPTSLSNVPSCVLNCTTTAATQTGCNGATDLPCVCTSKKFQAAAAACLQAQCSPSDQAVANELQNSSCAAISSTSNSSSSTTSGSTPKSGSSTLVGSATSSGSVAATASASNASSNGSSGAASGPIVGLGKCYVIGFVVVLAGIITGSLP